MVLDLLVKATLVLGVAALFSLGTRGRTPAAIRHAVWLAALVGAVLVPALSAALPALRLPLLPAELRGGPTVARATPIDDDDTAEDADAWRRAFAAPTRPNPATTAGPAAAYPDPSPVTAAADTRALLRGVRDAVGRVPALVLVWIVGAAVLLARVFASRLSVARLTRARIPGRAPWLPVARRLARLMRVSRRLRFLRSDRVAMPMACGVLRPAVVLPADADDWSADRLSAVLLHELGHVRRRDCLTQVAADVALALLWFHPLAWVARRAIRRERERACDDLVLAAGTPAPEYASHLLDVARDARHRAPSLILAGGVAMARPSELEGRLMAILDDTRPRRALTVRTCVTVALSSFALVAPMSALDLWQAPGAHPEAIPASPTERPGPDGRAGIVVPVRPAPRRPAPAMMNAGAQEPTPTPSPMPSPTPMAAAPPAPAVADALSDLVPALQPVPPAAPAPPAPPAPAADAVAPAIAPAPAKAAAPVAPAKAPKAAIAARRAPADPRVVAALTEALKDSDADVRRQALHTLARFRDPATVDALTGVLGHTDPDMRRQAAFALSQIRDPRAQKALATLLADTDPQVRRQALHALARLRDPAVLEPLTVALKDADPEMRREAAFSLGELRDPRAVPALTAAVTDANRDVREQAVFALGELRAPEAVAPLLTALRDADTGVRQQAAFALGQIRDPRAVDALMVAAKDQHTDVRRQAFFALGQVGDARAQDLAIAGLKDTDPEVRRMAAFALARIADRHE